MRLRCAGCYSLQAFADLLSRITPLTYWRLLRVTSRYRSFLLRHKKLSRHVTRWLKLVLLIDSWSTLGGRNNLAARLLICLCFKLPQKVPTTDWALYLVLYRSRYEGTQEDIGQYLLLVRQPKTRF